MCLNMLCIVALIIHNNPYRETSGTAAIVLYSLLKPMYLLGAHLDCKPSGGGGGEPDKQHLTLAL